jgi:hypothetical protein
MLVFLGRAARNRARIAAIRDGAPTAVEALARMFTDDRIADDGTVPGRLRAILAATENRFVPGLHNGMKIGLSGFREEYQDPWESSSDQVGHFLTAVRLCIFPGFLSNPLFPLLLGRRRDDDLPLRLAIGHEKAPDPPGRITGLRTLCTSLSRLRAQCRAATAEDIDSFRAGNLDDIQVGTGVGNSTADLRLSYIGWSFGQTFREGQFRSNQEIAAWVRSVLGGPGPALSPNG